MLRNQWPDKIGMGGRILSESVARSPRNTHTIGGDACDLLIGGDLVEKFGQHGRVAYIAGGELGCPDFQCLLVNSPSRRMCHSPAGQWM